MADYPSQEDLEEIKTLSNQFEDYSNLIEKLKEIWRWNDYIKHEGNHLELHTGGWSGNEDIIAALQGSMFWMFNWQKSERGGHYYFTLKEGE